MGEEIIIEGFSMLMMKSMFSTISASVVVLTEKSDGSLMFSALITMSRALAVFRFQLQTLTSDLHLSAFKLFSFILVALLFCNG